MINTLLLGLLKKDNQFSALSKTSGMKIRLGLSCLVELILIPLSLTLWLSTNWGSLLLECITSSNVADSGEIRESSSEQMIHLIMKYK